MSSEENGNVAKTKFVNVKTEYIDIIIVVEKYFEVYSLSQNEVNL